MYCRVLRPSSPPSGLISTISIDWPHTGAMPTPPHRPPACQLRCRPSDLPCARARPAWSYQARRQNDVKDDEDPTCTTMYKRWRCTKMYIEKGVQRSTGRNGSEPCTTSTAPPVRCACACAQMQKAVQIPRKPPCNAHFQVYFPRSRIDRKYKNRQKIVSRCKTVPKRLTICLFYIYIEDLFKR